MYNKEDTFNNSEMSLYPLKSCSNNRSFLLLKCINQSILQFSSVAQSEWKEMAISLLGDANKKTEKMAANIRVE